LADDRLGRVIGRSRRIQGIRLLRNGVAGTNLRIGLLYAKGLALGGLIRTLKKRVFIEHLLDLCRQLKGRQL